MPESHIDPGAYRKLDVTKKEIRLFDLHAGLCDEPLSGTLWCASIVSPCRYEALSWSWGPIQQDQESSICTVVDFGPLQIRPNLVDALRALRCATGIRTLWIDTICINQSRTSRATAEKEQQIRLTADIYRSADRVLMWLGSEISLLSRALSTFEKLANPKTSNQEAFSTIREAQEEPWGRNEESPKICIEECTVLQWLIWVSHFPYWRRLWVVQEVSLASSVAIICGKEYLDFENLIRAYERVRQLEPELSVRYSNIYPALSNIEQSLGLFRDCRRQNLNSGCIDTDIQSTPSGYGSSGSHHDFAAFVKLLTICRGQLCTDARDKIYGLLGLGSEALRCLIQPQYSTDPSKVFKDLALAILQESRSLFILSQATKYWFDNETAQSDTPSWLPSWTAWVGIRIEYEQAKYRLRQEMLFCACGSYEAANVELKNDELRLSGIVIDCVSSASTFSRWQEGRYLGKPNLEFLQTWGQKFLEKTRPRAKGLQSLEGQDPSSASSTSTSHIQGNEFESIFWQTWAHGQEPSNDKKEFQRCEADFLLNCELWKKKYEQRTQAGRDTASWRGADLKYFSNDLWLGTDIALYHSRFFLSEDGFLGLAGRKIMAGDKICVLAGGHLPFVLRPVEPKSNQFKLVCECYIKGVMDGEATRDPRWSYTSRRKYESKLPESQVDCSTSASWQDIFLI